MTLCAPTTIVGSVLGLAAPLLMFFLWQFSWISALVMAGVVVIGYIVAAATTRVAALSEFFRGLLIGVNTGLNVYLLYVIVGLFAPLPATIAVAVGLGRAAAHGPRPHELPMGGRHPA